MNELLLINPRKRRGRKSVKRGAGGRFVKARASNPSPRKRKSKRRARARNPIATNPVRRVSRRVSRSVSRRSRRRSNPIKMPGFGGIINNMVMPSVVGASGALALGLLMGLIPLPVAAKTGNMRHLVKGMGAVAIGTLGAMVLPRATAHKMAIGAMTVTLHDFMREQATRFFPALPLGDVGELGYYSPGYSAGQLPDNSGVNGMGFYSDNSNMGLYADESNMGEYGDDYTG